MYCVLADILEQLSERELIQLTDDQDLGLVDASVVDRAITDADAEIDGYCGTRYPVPFLPVPGMIRKVSVDLAVYNLYARRRGAPEDREKRYNNAVRFLKDVSGGRVSLGADAPVVSDDSGPEATTKKADRIFTRSSLDGF